MTSEHVERVAQAFSEAECLTEWRDVPDILRAQHRELARSTVNIFNHQAADYYTGAELMMADPRAATAISDACGFE